eukprot:TRINITY_DN30580_c0_g2_i1.p1 TRINITY_DN30580_c0_g2~~TRINITY_DN30580_c0_g2_i1.p1  ORF type:complete len:668 (-),score=93.36 TRINITY_DN30580_c0_g2_i1:125-2128(-)
MVTEDEGEQRYVAEETFSYAISLGSLCVTASWLQGQGLRTGSGPFDWVHSSPAMVRHCLRDDFVQYLDRTLYTVAGQTIGHKKYSDMQLGGTRKAVWLHHDPLRVDDDHALLTRSVDRLRNVLQDHSSERKLFILCILVKSARALEAFRTDRPVKPLARPASSSTSPVVHQSPPKIVLAQTDNVSAHISSVGNIAEMRMLFDDLCEMGVCKFHLDVVYLCTGTASSVENGDTPEAKLVVTESKGDVARSVESSGDAREPKTPPSSPQKSASRVSGGKTLAIHELHLIGGHTGLRFKEAIDERAFTELLLRSGSFRSSGNASAPKITRMTTKTEGDDVPRRRFDLRPLKSTINQESKRAASRYGDDVVNGKLVRRARGNCAPRALPKSTEPSQSRLAFVTSRKRHENGIVDLSEDGQGNSDASAIAVPKKRLRLVANRGRHSAARDSLTSCNDKRTASVAPAVTEASDSSSESSFDADSKPVSRAVVSSLASSLNKACVGTAVATSESSFNESTSESPSTAASSEASSDDSDAETVVAPTPKPEVARAAAVSSSSALLDPAVRDTTTSVARGKARAKASTALSTKTPAGEKADKMSTEEDDDLKRTLAASLREFKSSEKECLVEARQATCSLMLSELVEMGFERSVAESALRRAGGNQMQALNFLLFA